MPVPKPVVLAILDGWGYRQETDSNAIAAARTPHWDALWANYPHGVINASELHVGLPEGQMGNSEVGHMNIGSGRVVMQDLPRIDTAIKDRTLAKNPKLTAFIHDLKISGGVCHLMGLLSPGGVHSHQQHMAALAKLVAQAGIKVMVHAFLDGRDTPPRSADNYLKAFESEIAGAGNIQFATVSGRYYAMDRDNRWERVQLAYNAMADGKGPAAKTIHDALAANYANNKSDEFVLPTVLAGHTRMHDGDGILMCNFRADRAREILTALLAPDFKQFPRARHITFAAALGMVEYSTELNTLLPALFPPEPLTHILGEVIAEAGLKQLRIAETEKYAHVTFFFNGGREKEFPGETRILIPSPHVATYDLKPEMSAPEVTDKLVAAITSGSYDFIVVNYANTDMVGHTGDMNAAIKAVEAVDTCLGRLQAAVEKAGGALIVTADHGNAEMMEDHATHQAHTAHTLNLVPVVIATPAIKNKTLPIREGQLADIAPTVLDIMGIKKPVQMTGSSLLS